ncbi:hypothetical protein AVEN_161362-1 [Araneus ventricosus]|uniref:Uncharacterized protein n=1 Tax=Araneus ventricosus TaxID=182803 RepID=A0A4Y2SVV0_ARAVE|nr:hypothetical protein AVEN_267257-1 [Araneus ventricosus]GBN92091.1 hypothetical protein AVEN_271304-1 [Araneus ventricosus]GBN93508.1 hypothetical protein AVEN_28246-1 [Araneus ventricosus]GBN93515.1 hypothetical protein AVEN_161362-1 [Araneus ventricosus]
MVQTIFLERAFFKRPARPAEAGIRGMPASGNDFTARNLVRGPFIAREGRLVRLHHGRCALFFRESSGRPMSQFLKTMVVVGQFVDGIAGGFFFGADFTRYYGSVEHHEWVCGSVPCTKMV